MFLVCQNFEYIWNSVDFRVVTRMSGVMHSNSMCVEYFDLLYMCCVYVRGIAAPFPSKESLSLLVNIVEIYAMKRCILTPA